LTLDFRGLSDIRLIAKPIHAPSHELEDTDTNTPLTKLVNKRILVELLGIGNRVCLLYLCSMNPLAYFSPVFYTETFYLLLGVWCAVAFDV
jgi:hypothetical protein